MKKYFVTGAIVFSVGLNIAFISVGLYKHFDRGDYDGLPTQPPPPPEKVGEDIFGKRMGLSPAEKERLHQVRSEFRQKIRRRKERIKHLRADLFDIIKQTRDNPDFGKIDEIINEISDQQKEIQKLIIRKLMSERNLLPPDKRRKLDKIIRRRMERRRRGSGGFFHHGGGDFF